MAHRNPHTNLATHSVRNQPPPFEDNNLFDSDQALRSAVSAHGGAEYQQRLSEFGTRAGSAEAIEWSRQANAFPPQLVSFDRYGHRIDEVEFHPAYHQLMQLGFEAGIAGAAWTEKSGGHVLHSALMYMLGQTDGGVCCPMSMTYAVVPALRQSPALAGEWEPRVTMPAYDKRFLPPAEKTAATMGMAMTEKQGGSDIRANETVAHNIGGDEYELVGHKWFCSAPMCDAFLTLARTDAGVTCFLVPRWRPDGERNAFHIMRLKNKMGDRSNASSEIEYHNAWARRVGEDGKGVKTIIEMVMHTRLDCVVGSAGGMRAALAQALWHASHRTAFQKTLIDQPAMTSVLADLSLETWGATALAFRLARAFDKRSESELEAAFARLATPVAKYWVCKRQPGVVYEALECLGGAGFVEESAMPRLYRTAPLNAIWEGSGNVIALDVLRAISRETDSLDIVFAEIKNASSNNTSLRNHFQDLDKWRAPGALNEANARRFTEELALALEAAALAEVAPTEIFEAFCSVRLNPDNRSLVYGTMGKDIDPHEIVKRAQPC